MVLFSSFDDPFTLNQSNANNFSKKVIKILQNLTDKFIDENKDKLFKKDKSLLNDIVRQNLGNRAISGITLQLKNLWDLSYRIGEQSTNKSKFNQGYDLAEFVKMADFVERRVRSQEEVNTMTGIVLSESLFGEDYLRYRNKTVARNFTDTYTNTIFSSVSEFMNSERKTEDINLLKSHLGFRSIQELSDEERRAYDKWIKQSEDKVKKIYGLKKDVIEDPKKYDQWKNNLKGRIKRIASTESVAAFNLGRLNIYLERGYTEFIWQTGGEKECTLCLSKQGDIVTLKDLGISVASFDNIGWTDFNKIYTERDKNSYGTTPSGRSYDNTTAVVPPIHPFCDCRLIPREEGRRSKIEVESERMINKAQKYAKGALTLFKKTSAVAPVVFGAVSLGDDYLRRMEEMREKETNDILPTILATSSILGGGFLMFKFMQLHPTFIEKAKKTGKFLINKVVKQEVEKRKKTALNKYKEIKQQHITDILSDESKEEERVAEMNAYQDFTNLGLSPVLSIDLIRDLRKAESKGNYHDLVATKLREYLFNKLSPMQMNALSDLENLAKQTNFWERKFGKDAEQVKNITAVIENHLQLAKETNKSDIISVVPPSGMSRFKYFMQPSLQDVAVGGSYVFKNKSLRLNIPDTAKVINELRSELGRELNWATDKSVIRERLLSKVPSLNRMDVDGVLNDLQKTFPNSRAGLPTGNNLVLKAEKLHPLNIPDITSKNRVSDFSSRLESLKASGKLNQSALDNLEVELLNYQEEVSKWGKSSTKKQIDQVLLDLNDVRASKPLEIAELQEIKVNQKEQLKYKKQAIDKENYKPKDLLPTGKIGKKTPELKTDYASKLDSRYIKRMRKQRMHKESLNRIENIEKELDNISRSWYDPNSFETNNYLASSRSSKRSTTTERNLINLHGKLEREKKLVEGDRYLTSRIDEILNQKLGIVQTTNRGKKVKGSNKFFPEKLEGTGLKIAREKTKLYEQYRVIKETKDKTGKVIKNRLKGDRAIINNNVTALEKQLATHNRNISTGEKAANAKEKLRLQAILKVNKDRLKKLNENHSEAVEKIKGEIGKKIRSINSSVVLRDKEKLKLVEALTVSREEGISTLNGSRKLVADLLINYEKEIKSMINNL